VHFNFCNNHAQGRWMPSPYAVLFFPYAVLFFVLATRWSFLCFHVMLVPMVNRRYRSLRGGTKLWSYWEWRMSCCCVVVLCICFSWILCIKESADGGISCGVGESSCTTNVRKVCSLWCFAAGFTCVCCVVSWWNIPVCPHIIQSATLFQLLCIPLRVLRVALLICTARPFLS
jgi:hypothetical protein